MQAPRFGHGCSLPWLKRRVHPALVSAGCSAALENDQVRAWGDRGRVRWEGCEDTRSRGAPTPRVRIRGPVTNQRGTTTGKMGCSSPCPSLRLASSCGSRGSRGARARRWAQGDRERLMRASVARSCPVSRTAGVTPRGSGFVRDPGRQFMGCMAGGPRARAREYGLRRPSRSSETRGAGRRRCHDGARFARSCGGAAGRSGPASRRGGDGSRGERPPRRRDHWRGTRAGRVDPAAPRGAAKARRDGGADQGTTQIRAEMHG